MGSVDVLTREPIAIVGMASRFPQGADTVDHLWDFLLEARQAMTDFPSCRVNREAHYHPDPEHGGTFHVRGAHFLAEDPVLFDAPFFKVTKNELWTLDPQQRLIMENTYHALENAGIPIHEIAGSRTSVYASGFNVDHAALLNMDPETTLKYKPQGTSNSIISGRVSWFYDLKGPCMTLDTACSSSMVALHLACTSLQIGESDMSIVAGANYLANPIDVMGMAHHGFLSPDGKCFSFDHRANGYSRGEGVGSIIVKRVSDAIRDGNTIRAIIRATGVNQDGRTAGITLPSATAQESLIRDVYNKAGLDMRETRMLESHGTGTSAGDPIEANAAAKVFGPYRSSQDPLFIGAIKSGIGHLEGGAGVAGIIKSVLILETGIIPANVNFEKPNPRIPATKWNLKFPTANTSWPSTGVRRISVNSFGVGGTNGHAILDDAYSYLASNNPSASHKTVKVPPSLKEVTRFVTSTSSPKIVNELLDRATAASTLTATEAKDANHGNYPNPFNNYIENVEGLSASRIFTFSSFDEQGIERNAKHLAEYLSRIRHLHTSNEVEYLGNLAYTLSECRSLFPWRAFCVADSLSELNESLVAKGTLMKNRFQNQARIGLIFTGQGAQWHAMGRELLVFPIYSHRIKEASEYMSKLGAPWCLETELLATKDASLVNSASLSHPACAALQIALVDLLLSWNIIPSAVMGHSSGEIAAAYAAGRLSRQAAWKTAYWRGAVSAKSLKLKGAMLAVGLSTVNLQAYLEQANPDHEGELITACLNSPKNNTVSGDEDKIDALKTILDQNSVFARKLNVANAYHSAHMKQVADEYEHVLGDLTVEPPELFSNKIRMFSTVTGKEVTEERLGSRYWVENMVSPVRFADALVAMCYHRSGKQTLQLNSGSEFTISMVVEVGPHGAMRSAVKETLATQAGGKSIVYLNVLDRSRPGSRTILSVAGMLSCQGVPVDIRGINALLDTKPAKMLVNLPPYSFNHCERVIYESRLSKNFRLRKYQRHDLLGAPVTDWNNDQPRWRHIIRLSEQPWLRDHVVTGSYVYPGVGYIIMAIEASRQISDPNLNLIGFRLKDVSIKRALIIPDTKNGVEMCLSITKMDEASMWASSVWNRFSIVSYNPTGDDWIEHCTGYIAVEYELPTNPIDNGLEEKHKSSRWSELIESTFSQCQTSIDIEQTYDNLVTTGLNFGPLFRNLSDVKGSGKGRGEISTIITVPDVVECMPKKYIHPHLIHPSTMDSMFHHFLLSVLDLTGKSILESAMVPVFVKEIWLSANVNPNPGSQFRGYGKSTMIAYEKYESDILVWDGRRDEGILSIKGLKATPLESSSTTGVQRRDLCHTIEWSPAPEFILPTLFSHVKRSGPNEDEEYLYWINRMQLAVILSVTDALEALPPTFDPGSLEAHSRRYYDWLLYQKDQLDKDRIIHISKQQWEDMSQNEEAKKKLLREVANHNGDGALAMRMGANIVPYLTNQSDPLQIMFDDDLLDRVYDEAAALGDIPALFQEYLNHMYNTSSNLKVLEIGAGTGASTAMLLAALTRPGNKSYGTSTCRVIQYTFSDVSTGFFEKAKERFSAWRDIIEFKTYNAEKDPTSQGLSLASYDLVVAGNVVHTTASLEKTLTNIRILLKPGGRLLMQEGVRQNFLWSPLAFGQLPGWWRGVEPSRQWSPWVPTNEWESHLAQAGFDASPLSLQDRERPDLHTQSLFIATAAAATKEVDCGKLAVITSDSSADGLANLIRSRLGCSLIHYLDISKHDLHEFVCVSCIEFEREVLSDPTEEEYLNIRHLLSTSDGILWITANMESNPALGMIVGMMRSIRWERDVDGANLVPVSITDPRSSKDALVSQIMRVFTHQFLQDHPRTKNAEYMLGEDVILTSRIVESEPPNEFLNSKFVKPGPQMRPLCEAGRPIKLSTSSPGLLNKLEFVTDTVYYEPLPENLVEIEIRAVGLNFRDVMIAMGEHMAYSLGNEAAGVVTRVGSLVPDLAPGDRVVYMCGFESVGCFHTYGRVQWQNVVRIPDSLSFEVAAGLPCVYSTVIYGLHDIAHLSKGETILIHAAAGGIGQAAIQLAKNAGAEIFATVSASEKKELLVTEYGIAEDHIFSSRDLTFVSGIRRMTDGRGVDVLLNSLSGEALRGSWDILAPFGRFIEIGKKDSQGGGRIPLEPFLRQATMASVELPMMMRHKPLLFRRLIADTIRLYAESKIHQAKPTTVMSYGKIEEALRLLQSGRGMGKIILVPSPTDIVPLVPQPQTDYTFEDNATFVLAGGLGGIGRSIALWMAAKGARHIVFLSRSGRVTESVKQMMCALQGFKCEAHIFVCDVSDRQRVQEVVYHVAQTLPPIKGCIQASMVLKDGMFENMTFDDYQTVVRPKVQGSWNLHGLLPKTLDFFVMLSSATGILGNRSQANYAAGNNYQDWLARYRLKQGMPSISVDLGTVLSVGYVAEHRENMTTLGNILEVIREDELHVLLEYAIDPRSRRLPGSKQGQLVVGLTTAEYLRQRGVPPLTYLTYPLFTHLNVTSVSLRQSGHEDPAYQAVAALPHASSLEEAMTIVCDGIRYKLASLLAIPVENIDPAKSVSSNGVDSLVAMEFRAWVAKDLGADVPLLDIMGTGSLEMISDKVVHASGLVHLQK